MTPPNYAQEPALQQGSTGLSDGIKRIIRAILLRSDGY